MPLRPSLTQALIAAGAEAEALLARGERAASVTGWASDGTVVIATDTERERDITIVGVTDEEPQP